ncbi:hypothetical protein [Streptomyces sp. LN785]|uniref:hypothetical protein n=1 Tax=Streptomyces sp. LN785 TaxID=3112983 RepID=UPI00371C7042
MIRGRSGGRAAGSQGRASGANAHESATGPVTAPSGRWLFLGHDGRLTAYGAASDGLARWTEHTTGTGRWHGPEVLEVPGWTGHVTMAQSQEGYVHFAARVADSSGAGQPRIVVATQFQTGRGLTPWHSLGVPRAADGESGDAVVHGPLTVVNPTLGSIHVLMSLRHGGILRRSRNRDGNWGGWKAVTDRPYPGEPGAAMTEGGPLEILAPGPGGADRWVGTSKGRFEFADRIGTPVVPGTVTACETGPKRATYFWRYPGDGSLVAWRQQSHPAQDGGVLMPLGGAGGRGMPAVTRAVVGGYDCTVLAQLGLEGGVEVTAYVTENEGYGMWWAPLGGPDAQSAQVVVDGTGRLVVAVLDKESALHLTRQDTAQEGLAFGSWNRVA